jgi:hypothetical protein
VISNLSNLVSDHPDVQALGLLLQDAGGTRPTGGAAESGISWPPMLLGSYTAAIRRDAYEPGALVAGSPDEMLAAHLLVTGIWTCWRPPPEEAERTRGFAPAREPDPALARVLEYVDAVAARRGQPRATLLEKLDVRQCAIGTGLPTAVARRALTQLREERP